MSKHFFISLVKRGGIQIGNIQELSIPADSDLNQLVGYVSNALSSLMVSAESDVACLYNRRTMNKIMNMSEIRNYDIIVATLVLNKVTVEF